MPTHMSRSEIQAHTVTGPSEFTQARELEDTTPARSLSKPYVET